MSPVLSPVLVAIDALCAMGIGYAIAVLRAMLPYKNKKMRFVIDFFITFLGLFLLQAHVAQNSNSGQLRFFMLVAMIFGAFSANFTITPFIVFLKKSIHNILCFLTTSLIEKCLKKVAICLKHKIIEFFKSVLCEKIKNKTQKHLKFDAVLLYNSTIDK